MMPYKHFCECRKTNDITIIPCALNWKSLLSKHLENPYHKVPSFTPILSIWILMTLFISSASDNIPFHYKNCRQVHLCKLPLGASVYALEFGANISYYNNDCWCTSCNYIITVFRLQSDTMAWVYPSKTEPFHSSDHYFSFVPLS